MSKATMMRNYLFRALQIGFLVVAVACQNGCVTRTTIRAAEKDVEYKPQRLDENGKLAPPEIQSVREERPAFYVLVPLAVAADIALTPVYLGVFVAVNAGLMKPPY